MIKIAYCAHSKVPSREANSIHVMKMCQALANQNVNVELVVPNMKTESGDPFDFYGVKNNFAINHINWPRVKFGVLIYSYRVLNYLIKNNKDVVYGRDLTTCFMTASHGLPTIWESHSPVDYWGFPYIQFFKRMIKKKSFLKIVVISSTLRDYYIHEYKISPDKIIVLPDCSDLLDIDNINPIKLASEGYKVNVGYIGQLYPGKGMEIISQLVPQCPNVMFHVIGGKESDISFWKAKLNDFNNIIFYGFKKPSETASYGISMDILIAPYMRRVQGVGGDRSDISNWMSPLKLFEYMSYRKPIIASDLPVLHDVLNNDNSVLCNPDNIQEWVNAINLLIDDKDYANKLSSNAYTSFVSNFTWGKRAKKIVELFSCISTVEKTI